MNYHNILHDDMRNGEGLRVVLFVAGCGHHCIGCHNPQTWDNKSGILFAKEDIEEIYEQLSQNYISGITISGGDPLFITNRYEIKELIEHIKNDFPNKTIWLYTGYTWEEINNSRDLMKAILQVDVLVDGEYKDELLDVNYPWAGSTNQRVIDVHRSLEKGELILWGEITN